MAVTQQDIQATQTAQQDFENAVGGMGNILNGVQEANYQLITREMQSSAGIAFGKVMTGWLDKFNDITRLLQQMADMLGTQWQTTQAAEQHNIDLAAGTPQP
jgi:hypothetical protein